MESRWRRASKAVIAPLEVEYKARPYGEFKKALFNAYPFGDRVCIPYKIWCQEQRAALSRHPESPVYKPQQELVPQQELPGL